MNPIREALKALPGNWHQGEYDGPGDTHCGLGHIHAIMGTTPYSVLDENTADFSVVADLLGKVAAEQYPERAPTSSDLCKYVAFNDHADTTEADVILVFEKAAARLDEQV